MNVACVSDISLGYGSPQIISLVRSLHACLGGAKRPLVLEVDQPERPPRHDQFPDLELVRLYTMAHPHKVRFGKVQWILKAARLLNKRKPEVLVFPNTICLPALWNLRYRPKLVIYYVLEMPFSFGWDREEDALNRLARDKIDLVIYSERNRARAHLDAFQYHSVPNVIVYNVSPLETDLPVPADWRNGRILYQGTIHEERTGGRFLLDERIQEVPIDLYGVLDGCGQSFAQQLQAGLGRVRYCGYVDNATLRTIRRQYGFSLVYWAPTSDNQRYACPNKYFESVADGVPPITAPHPQTKTLTERYRCGIVMEDWSLAAFARAIQRGMSLLGTPEYEEMVANCRRAHELELNWESQFAKVAAQLARMGHVAQCAGAPVVAAT